jgi:hypothetical protein
MKKCNHSNEEFTMDQPPTAALYSNNLKAPFGKFNQEGKNL